MKTEKDKELTELLSIRIYVNIGRDKLHTKFTFFTVDTVDANELFQIDCVDNGKSEFCM